MKHLFTLFFILTLTNSIAQTTNLYDIKFSTGEGYTTGKLHAHDDWQSTNDWGCQLQSYANNGRVSISADWTRIHHQVAVKTTETQNVIQLIVSFMPWNDTTGNVIANTGTAGSFLAVGLNSITGSATPSKGTDKAPTATSDDQMRYSFLYVSQDSKWKINSTQLNESAVNGVGYHLKMEFIIGADAANSTTYVQLQKNNGTAIGSPVNIGTDFPDALFTALKSGDGGGYFIAAAQDLTDHVNGNDIRLTRVRANLLSASTLHTQELNDFRFTLYPNPAKDVIGFQSELPLASVEIFSLTGSKVLSKSNNVEQVEVGNLAKGIYMLKATAADGKVATQKLIKE